jgi:polyferredoxin
MIMAAPVLPTTMPSGHFNDLIPGMFFYAKWFIGEFQAFIMIGFGVAIAFTLLTLIASLFMRKKETKDDEDDIDYI